MTELTQKNYNTEIQNVKIPILIEFSASCAMPAELTEKYADRCKFCRVDVGKQALFAQKFDLLKLPTSILMHDGKIIQRISGHRSNEEWKKILNLD